MVKIRKRAVQFWSIIALETQEKLIAIGFLVVWDLK